MSTTTNETETEIPRWANLLDGERALVGINSSIADLNAAIERAVDRAMLRAWVDPSGNGEELRAIIHLRQTLAVANLLRDRTEKLIAILRSKAA